MSCVKTVNVHNISGLWAQMDTENKTSVLLEFEAGFYYKYVSAKDFYIADDMIWGCTSSDFKLQEYSAYSMTDNDIYIDYPSGKSLGYISDDNIHLNNGRSCVRVERFTSQTYVGSSGDDDKGSSESEPEPEPDLKVSEWGISGTMTQWVDGHDIPMYVYDKYAVAYNVTFDDSDKFKIRSKNSWSDAEKNLGYIVSDKVVINSVNLLVTGYNSKDIIAVKGSYDVYLDYSDFCLYVMSPGMKPDDASLADFSDKSSDWGICGTFTGWGTEPDIMMYEFGDYHVAFGVELTSDDEFKFRKNNNWAEELSSISQVSVEFNNGYYMANGGGKGNITVSDIGEYYIYLSDDKTKCYFMEKGKLPSE